MHAERKEAGFSLIGMLLFLAILGGAAHAAYLIFPVYSTYWKVQDTFASVTHNLSNRSEDDIRARLPDILDVQNLHPSDLPKAFYDNLTIRADGKHVQISSSYDVVVWLLGKPKDMGENASEAHGLDALKYKGRIDFHFQPHDRTP